MKNTTTAPPNAPAGVTYKEIPNAKNYWAGTDGTVWRMRHGRTREPKISWRQIKACLSIPSPKGRYVLNIGSGTQRRHVFLHTVILETFVGPRPSPSHQCCHFPDRDPANNRLDNLRWGTGQDNNHDQELHGTRVWGEQHPLAKIRNNDVAVIRYLKPFLRAIEVAKIFGISRSYVYIIWCGADERTRYANQRRKPQADLYQTSATLTM